MIIITGYSLCSDWRQLHTRRFGQGCSAQSLCSNFFNRRHDQQSRMLSLNDIVYFHPESWPLFWINGPPFCIDWMCLLTLLNTRSVNAVIFHWCLRDRFRAGLELKVKVDEYSVSEWMIYFYIAHTKTSTQNLACSQRQIHTVHTCKLSQAKNYQRTLIPKSRNSPYPPTHQKMQLYIAVKCKNIYRAARNSSISPASFTLPSRAPQR